MKTLREELSFAAMVLVGCGSIVLAQVDAGEGTQIDPRAESIVREACRRMQSLVHGQIEVSDTMDIVFETGQKVQYAHRRSATISRPDKLVVESTGDVENRKLWKDGKTVTLLDRDHNVYAQIADPGTLDQMMDTMHERFGVEVPLADLLSGDPAEVLLGRVQSGSYLGLHGVDAHMCHHVAFRREDIDWQAWIDAGEQPVIRKLVITYKNMPQSPQYAFKLISSTVLDSVPADVFLFKAPAGCEKIRFLPVRSEVSSPKE